MSMKKFELAKQIGLKVTGQMKAAGVPDRFGQGAVEILDKREQRKRDAALGLVPFACKLPAELTRQLHERASGHEGGMNGLVAGLLQQALAPAAPLSPAKTKPARKPDGVEASADETAVAAPAKKKAVSRKP